MNSKLNLVSNEYSSKKNTTLSNDDMLYLDFFKFCFEEKGLQSFKFTELANWLLDNNINFRNEFAGSHLAKSYRVHKKSSFIKKRFNKLFDELIIEVHGDIESERNYTKTSLYKFTITGFIKSHGIYKRNYSEKYDLIKEKHRNILYEYAKKEFDNGKNIEEKFYFLILRKMHHDSEFDDFLSFASVFITGGYRFHLFTLLFPWLDEGGAEGFGDYYFTEPEKLSKPNFISLIKKILSDLDENTKKILLYQLKLGLEDYYYLRFSTSEFETLRFENRTDHEKLTIQTFCSLCKSYFPQTVDCKNFLKYNMGSLDKSYVFSCPTCDVNKNTNHCCVVEAYKSAKFTTIIV